MEANNWSAQSRLRVGQGLPRSAQRKMCQTAEDKIDFVTFSMLSVKHSVAYQAKNWSMCKVKQVKKKKPRILGPPDVSMSFHTEGTTVQMGGDSTVADRVSMGTMRWDKTHGAKLGHIQRTLHSCGRGACPVGRSDDYVMVVFPRAQSGGRPHGRGRAKKDHVLGGDNTEKLKAVRGFLDGSNKRDGWSGCWCCHQRCGPGTSESQSVKLQCRGRLVRPLQRKLRKPVCWEFWIRDTKKDSVENLNQFIDEIMKPT